MVTFKMTSSLRSIQSCAVVAVLLFLTLFGEATAVGPSPTTVSSTMTKATTTRPTIVPSLPTDSAKNGATCEFRTINYITHRLPQQCLRSTWIEGGTHSTQGPEATVIAASLASGAFNQSGNISASIDLRITNIPTALSEDAPASPTVAAIEGTAEGEDSDAPEFDDAAFLSFEDWKKQNLELSDKVGNSADGRRSSPGLEQDPLPNDEGLGVEGDLKVEFRGFRAGAPGDDSVRSTDSESVDDESSVKTSDSSDKKDTRLRSKDAGKTCKERFSYSSFDAGATVLKTNAEAKNAKALLVENKDSYMLTPCSAKNKYLIVELSDDILVDTVVLANFEFFSSMFRHFRVSVSDRYPVKLERWKDLGTFEARNSREIQAFLVENPLIWARYLRVEFLSHYGNEFYCPVSILRIHGKSQLEDYRQQEEAARGEVDSAEDEDVDEESEVQPMVSAGLEQQNVTEPDNATQQYLSGTTESHEATDGSVPEPQRSSGLEKSQVLDERRDQAAMNAPISQWPRSTLEELSLERAAAADAMCAMLNVSGALPDVGRDDSQARPTSPSIESVNVSSGSLQSKPTILLDQVTASPDSSRSITQEDLSAITKENPNSTTSTVQVVVPSSISSLRSNLTASTTVTSRASSTTSAPAATPTTQESFFKTVSRRLQLLETNSTLSLRYIEDQSRNLREAFTKVEKRQLSKTTSFLETLNSTVLAELQQFRQQYDQIWQSTVIELETQRDQSQREILAVSSRLNLLADEVLFQRRMSIVQSVLLLLCLGLVIFSRTQTTAYNDAPLVQNFLNRTRSIGNSQHDGYSRSNSPRQTSPGQTSPSRQNKEANPNMQPGRRWDDSPVHSARPQNPEEASNNYLSLESASDFELETGDTEYASSSNRQSGASNRHIQPNTSQGAREDEQFQSTYNSRPSSQNVQWLEDSQTTPEAERHSNSVTVQIIRAQGTDNTSIEGQSIGESEYIDALQIRSEQDFDDTYETAHHLPSPPPEEQIRGFSIARKPLPALPHEA